MSWLIGKAESLLNNLDQSAAEALNSPADRRPSNAPDAAILSHSLSPSTPFSSSRLTLPDRPDAADPAHLSASKSSDNIATLLANTSNIKRTTSEKTLNQAQQQQPYHNGHSREAPSPSQSRPTVNRTAQSRSAKNLEEEKLFEFLNSPEGGPPADAQVAGRKRERAAGTPSGSGQQSGSHSRQSSTSSSVSAPSVGRLEFTAHTTESDGGGGGVVVEEEGASAQPPGQPPVESQLIGREPAWSPREAGESSLAASQQQQQLQQLSSLELENKLLKNEVASLNQEMSSVVQRSKVAQEEVSRLRSQLEGRGSQMSEMDGLVRALRGQQEDLRQAVGAKDSQLAVLRVRLQEADQELQSKIQLSQSLQTDNNRILKDHSDSSGIHSQALESLQQKLHETEMLLHREQEAYKTAQGEMFGRQEKVEMEKQTIADSLVSSQKKYQEEKGRASTYSAQLKTLRANWESAKQELADYKLKATRILQSKEKLISSLKEGVVTSGGSERSGSLELEEVRQERDLLREELAEAQVRVEELRGQMGEQEAEQQADLAGLREELREGEERLEGERQRASQAEAEVRGQAEEMGYLQAELGRLRVSSQAQLEDREQQIQQLRTQLTTKNLNSTSQTELENRVHSLTESLIQKQTLIETLGTEKNSLHHQLERLEKQFREAKSAATPNSSYAVNIHPNHHHHHHHHPAEEGVGLRSRGLPEFLSEAPGDSGVTRGVKKAATTIDRFSIRLGIFLRRYPVARLFVIFYMVLLHLWVMVVLLTYTPEIHGHDWHPAAPRPPEEE